MWKSYLYRSYTSALKIAAKVIPMPKPTLFSGVGAVTELAGAIADLGYQRVLLVTDQGLVKVGIAQDVMESLQTLGIEVALYSEVKPDPTYEQVEAGLSQFHANGCDAIVALGGGSAMDCGKVIAARVTNKRSIARLAGLFRVWHAPAPLFVIPTTAGTGSEVTIAAVVSEPTNHKKTPLIDPKLVPLMAAIDPSLMIGLPPRVSAETGIDALTHAIEALVSKNTLPETQAYSIAAIKLIFEHLPRVVEQGDNLESRLKMSMASYYGGLAFTKASLGYVHAISHNLGAKYGISHGFGNALALLPVLRFSLPDVQSQLAQMADVIGGEKALSEVQKADWFIAQLETLLSQVHLESRTPLIQESDMDELIGSILHEAHWNYPVPKFMDENDCYVVLKQIQAD
ncbi:iron-containing alcohol dehydrogenase [Vibrio astriarenae]|uniref:iron-containing alcohol dehydrogenase n=1 Tax=Vibrio astriarenae TaxID=1481923 RepID=UPI003736A20C